MSRSAGYDRHITIFSPEGRLYQVEYACKAVKNSGLTALGLRGADADKLIDPTAWTNVYKITDYIGCVTAGFTADCRALVFRAREIAAEFKNENGYDIPVHYLANKVADKAQLYTQQAFMRPYAVVGMFFAFDDEKGPQLYQVEPSGFYAGQKGSFSQIIARGFQAFAAGAKDQEAQNALEKVLKKAPQGGHSETEVIQQAIATLQTVLGMDFKPSDLEVAFVSSKSRKFLKLTEAQIDEHLNAIAEKD